jgi:hypothetical protein
MARQRNYAAEYVARQERATERGFSSYYEERQFRVETAFEREIAGESIEWQERNPGDWRSANPEALAMFYERVLEPMTNGQPVTGMDRHNAVAFFIEYEDMSEEAAIDAMRELYGES